MRKNIRLKNTLTYYNKTADSYFATTITIDMSSICNKFLNYLPHEASIIDIGAGSGRELRYFKAAGYKVDGIDASVELCKLATKYSGVEVECVKLQDWKPDKKYHGVWSNAVLSHLQIKEIETFILRLEDMLLPKGVAYLSFKTGIQTGVDELGRYFSNISVEEVGQIVAKSERLEIKELWLTDDKMGRDNFRWINVIVQSYY